MGDKSKPDQIMEDVQSIEDNEELIERIDSAEEESFDDESPLIELVLEAEPEEGTAAAEPEHENDEDDYDETVLIDDIVGEDIDEEALSSFEETILLDDIAGEDLISDEDVVDFDPETDEEAALSLEISPEEDEGDDIIDLDTDAIAAPRSDDEHPEIVKDHISDKENDDVIDLDADAIAGSREADEIFPLEEKDDDIIELDADTANTDHDVREDKEGQLEEFADTDAEIIIAPYGLEDAESVPKPEPDAEEKDFIDLEAESILASQEPDFEETIFLGDADYVSEPRKAEKKEDEFTDSDEETIIAPYGLEETVLMQDTVPKSGFEEKKDFIDLEAENILASQDFEETIFMGDAGHVSEISKADKKQDEFTDSDEETIIAPYGLDDSDSILKPDAEEKDFIDLEAESILASQEPDFEETIFLGDADYVPEPQKAEKKENEFTDSDEETIIAPYGLEDNDGILKPDAEEENDIIDLEAANILASNDFEQSDFLRQAAAPKKLRDEDSLDGMEGAETIIMPHGLEDADSPEAVRPKPSTLKSASEPIDLQEYAEELLLTDDDIVDLPLETILSPEELDKINGSESDFSRVPEDDEIIDLGEDSIVEPPQSKSDEPSEDTPPFDIEEVFEPDDNATIIVSDYSEADAEIKGLMAEDSADDILPAEFLAGDTEGYQQQEKDLLELLEMDLDLKADQRAHLLFDEIQEAEQEAENEKESQKTDVPPKLTGDGDVGFQERQKLKKDAKTEKEEKTPLISDEIPLQDLEKEISSYPPEQLEAVLEQVIKRVFSEKAFSEKIEGKLIEVIERAVSKEIDRLKDVLFEDISDDDLLN